MKKMVGSALVTLRMISPPSTCVYFDALSSSCHLQRHVPRLDLKSSFLDHSSLKLLWGSNNLRKQSKSKRSLVIVDELPGQYYEDNFEDVKNQIVDYFTYKAVWTVLNQLYQTNPKQYRWFYNYVASNQRGYGKRFVRELGKVKRELAERVMATRLRLYEEWGERCDHSEMYERIADQNLELMRERLMETLIWPYSDTDSNPNATG